MLFWELINVGRGIALARRGGIYVKKGALMAKDLPWKYAIAKVLTDAQATMSPSEIAEAIVSKNLRKKVGATPANSVVSNISGSLREDGPKSPFVRLGRGEYAAKSLIDSGSQGALDEAEELDDKVTGGIKAFGIYWEKSDIDWKKPKLLGQQQIGADKVDLSEQIGVYLLYDAREIVYVGRSTEQTITRRLQDHTKDRLKARWNRFSWFGLYSVARDTGRLEMESPALDKEALIQTLEAVLIEAIEPRQNRRRGDVFSEIEYIQTIDPKIQRDRRRASLDELLRDKE